MVLPADLYGGTYRLVDKVLSRWGLAYDLVDQTDLDAVERAVRDETRLIWVESPTNPLLNVVDIEGVVAGEADALVAVDNTFATPVNQRPLELGADFVVHSTTKYLGGHSDVVGGRRDRARPRVVRATAVRPERRRRRSRTDRLLPRPSRASHAAAADGRARAQRAAVVELLRGDPRGRATCAGRASAAWSASATRDAAEIATRTRLFTLAESLGGVESLIELPQAMTHQSVEDRRRPSRRISCG